MKIIIIEDSRLARQELHELLKEQTHYDIVADAKSVAEGIELINQYKPDLVLLDIQLPDGDGFSLLEQLDSVPQVIFTTAYDKHAVSAFEYNALDYLLKPIEKDRLLSSLSRAKQKLPDDKLPIKTINDKIFIRDGDNYHFVKLSDVFLIEVEGNYTRVCFGDKSPLLSRSLNYLEQRLDTLVFFRANRQSIINLDYVEKVEPWVSDGLLVTLKNGKEIEVSRRQTKSLLALLEM